MAVRQTFAIGRERSRRASGRHRIVHFQQGLRLTRAIGARPHQHTRFRENDKAAVRAPHWRGVGGIVEGQRAETAARNDGARDARDVLDKYPAEALRLLYTQAHYGGPLNFTEELLAGAQKGLEKLNNLRDRINQELRSSEGNNSPSFDFNKFYKSFEEAMDDDFNTPQAVAVIFDFTREVNRIIAENENISKEFFTQVKDFLQKTASDVLGIVDFEAGKAESDGKLEGELIELLIKIRQEAKKDKNFKLADSIRDELKDLGIQLQDSKDKTTYKKIN